MNFAQFNTIIPPQDIEHHPQCLQRIAKGDGNAFEWLYKNYCSKLYHYILLLTNEPPLAKDIVQEIFLKLWVHREKLLSVSNFNAYLYACAKNLLTDQQRRQQREKEYARNVKDDGQQVEHNLYYLRQEEELVNMA
jgi:RNA polymerase sigma-70 factor (ECF subfamily)